MQRKVLDLKKATLHLKKARRYAKVNLNAYVGKDSFNAFTPDTPSGRSILLRSLQSARVAPVLWRKSKCFLNKKQCIVTHHIQYKLHCLQKKTLVMFFTQALYKRDIRIPENAVIIRPQRTPCLLSNQAFAYKSVYKSKAGSVSPYLQQRER